MRILCFNPGSFETQGDSRPQQKITCDITFEVAAFEQHPTRRPYPFGKPFCNSIHRIRAFDFFFTKNLGRFGQIWGNDSSKRQQALSQRLNGILRKKPIFAFGNHDWVDYDEARPSSLKHVGHNINDGCIAQHADFHGIDRHIIKEHIELSPHELGRDSLNSENALRILRSKCCYDTAAIGTACRHGLNIGKKSCTPGRINAGNA